MHFPYWMEALAISSGDLDAGVERAAHAALAEAGLYFALSENKHLSRDSWRRAWDAAHVRSAASSQAASVGLVQRSLAAPEIDHAVRTDRRAIVMESLTRFNPLTGESLERALSYGALRKTSSGAASLLVQDGLPPDRVDDLKESLNLSGLLRVLSFGPPGRLDRGWSLRRAASFGTARSGTGRRNMLIQLALLRDAGLAPAMLEAASKDEKVAALFSVPLAGSRSGARELASGGLDALIKATPIGPRGFMMMALAGNPSCTEELLSQIASCETMGVYRAQNMASGRLKGGGHRHVPPGFDVSSDSRAAVLSLCSERSVPGGMYDSSGKPERMLLLARNINLPDADRETIASTFGQALADDVEGWVVEEADRNISGWIRLGGAHGRPRLEDSLVSTFNSAGTSANVWSNIAQLGPRWTGTMSDLVATASLL